MRKTILSIILMCCLSAFATEPVARVGARDGWSAGIDGGVATPLKGGAFVKNMRGIAGVNVNKFVTPAWSLGAEAWWGVNTSSWPGMQHSTTAFDNSYVGLSSFTDIVGLVRGRACRPSPFKAGFTLGAGWGHYYRHPGLDHNYFAAKVGMLLSMNLCPRLSLTAKPAIIWNVSDSRTALSSATLNGRRAMFAFRIGLTYNFGDSFECIIPYDQAQIDGLNVQVNDLRRQLDRANANLAETRAANAALLGELEACKAAKPEVIREVAVDNRLNTVVDVFFLLGSSTVTRDQMPNVERIASYLNNHPGSTVVIKGYASRDGDQDANLKLAQRRAEAVKNLLIKKYNIAADRVSAQGAGIGDMFEEDSWNRVSVCTLQNAQ